MSTQVAHPVVAEDDAIAAAIEEKRWGRIHGAITLGKHLLAGGTGSLAVLLLAERAR